MSTLNSTAEAAREAARDEKGQFGSWASDESVATLTAEPQSAAEQIDAARDLAAETGEVHFLRSETAAVPDDPPRGPFGFYAETSGDVYALPSGGVLTRRATTRTTNDDEVLATHQFELTDDAGSTRATIETETHSPEDVEEHFAGTFDEDMDMKNKADYLAEDAAFAGLDESVPDFLDDESIDQLMGDRTEERLRADLQSIKDGQVSGYE